MTKRTKSGIVLRNCATISKSEEVCEFDKEGDELCYCLTDYCNSADSAAANSFWIIGVLATARALT